MLKALSKGRSIVLIIALFLLTTFSSSAMANSPKVVYSAKPITDSKILKERAFHGITDIEPKPINNSFKQIAGNKSELHNKTYSTVQKISEVIDPDGSKTTKYRQTSFIFVDANSTEPHDPVMTKRQDDPTYSWGCTVTLTYNEYTSGTSTFDQVLSGKAEWDTEGQVTGVPSISGAYIRTSAVGFEPNGTYFSQDPQKSIGVPTQYTTYTQSVSFPYVDTNGNKGMIGVDGHATLSLNGDAWSWDSKFTVGNAIWCC